MIILLEIFGNNNYKAKEKYISLIVKFFIILFQEY